MHFTVAFTTILGIGLWIALPSGVQCLSETQSPMTVPHSIHSPSPSNLVGGEDIEHALYQRALSLRQDVQDGWQRLVHSPTTDGSSRIETIAPSDLRPTIESWGLTNLMNDKVHHDLQAVVQRAIDHGVYVRQEFSYNSLPCAHPACLSTLIVVVQVPYLVHDYVWKVELGHVYINSLADTVKTCHRCWFETCCHSRSTFCPEELQEIQAVMSTSQSEWALNNLAPPAQVHENFLASTHSSLPTDLVRGGDVWSVLRRIALRWKQDTPADWQRVMHSPVTSGSSGVETLAPADLRSTIGSWGVVDEMQEKAYRDIYAMIQLAVDEGVYIAQGFSYNWPSCQDSPQSTCLSTLAVVVKVPYVIPGYVWRVELAHVYTTSVAETIEQFVYSHTCHRCWFKTCCHDSKDVRSLTPQELMDVQSVMSTSQSEWAMGHIPQQESFDTPSDMNALGSFGAFEPLLRTILNNDVENRDVYKTHRGGILEAVQNATLSRHQTSNNMELSASDEDIAPLLEDLLESCFVKAGIQEPVKEWWERAYSDSQGHPISVECEFARQSTEPIVPPSAGCMTSTKVTVDTEYSWLLVVPHENSFDILLLESELGIAFEDCKCDGNEIRNGACSLLHVRSDNQGSGSNVRWGYIKSDGSVGSVEYLAEWKSYPAYVSKVLLDLLRFATASSYLKVPPPVRSSLPTPALVRQAPMPTSNNKAVEPLVTSPSFGAIMMAINQFADTWDKVMKTFGPSSRTDIKRRVCLGFDALDYSASSMVLAGVDVKNLPLLVEDVIDTEDLPKRGDIKRLMSGVKYSTNFTWIGESMTYSNPDGTQSYLFFSKYADALSGMADVVYCAIKSTFTLAPDMLIVHRQKTGLLGFGRSDETSIEYVPHTLTLNDTLILEMFWEMIAFHQLALAMGAEPPKYPDLSGLCDRSIP
ncbi:hypothetical protein EMPS_00146 [Entomortierella parvispora]|uniref:Uncharacterized protein n=1 Tax=Entomortierella parvispora TaxID=205924 RepID=A0A9P3GZI4_9FUNG|nr:hypothetical protein EMPS_00146 [Entomortierella parvispora]